MARPIIELGEASDTGGAVYSSEDKAGNRGPSRGGCFPIRQNFGGSPPEFRPSSFCRRRSRCRGGPSREVPPGFRPRRQALSPSFV